MEGCRARKGAEKGSTLGVLLVALDYLLVARLAKLYWEKRSWLSSSVEQVYYYSVEALLQFGITALT